MFLIFGLAYSLLRVGISHLNVYEDKLINQYFFVLEAKENYVIVTNLLTKYYLPLKDNDLNMGDIISISGDISTLKLHAIAEHFDFKDYLHKSGVIYQINSYKTIKLISLFIHKKIWVEYLFNGFSSDSAVLGKSLLFGIESSKLISKFGNPSFTYLLSLSGIYLSTFFRMIFRLFNKKFNSKISFILTITILFPYILLLFDKLVIYRIILLQLAIIFLKDKYKISYFEAYIYIYTFFALLSPFNVFEMSLFVPMFIVTIRKFINFLKLSKLRKEIITYFALSLVLLIIDGKIAFFDGVFRILLVPFLFINYLIFFLSVILQKPYLANKISPITLKVITLFKNFSISVPFSSEIVICILILFGSLMYGMFLKHQLWIKFSLVSLIFLFGIDVLPIRNYMLDQLYFLDVGQGDCAILIHRNKTLMIDTGGLKYDDLALTSIIPFFQKKRVHKVDYIICSHPDFDHIGALDSLTKNFKVGELIENRHQFPFKFGDITIENLNTYEASNINDLSLVNRFTFLGLNWLFMGDASQTIEKKIIKDNNLEDIDIIKLGHHGSNTSTSKELIMACRPQEVVISLGYENFYGFPHQEVLDLLNFYKIKIKRTDIEGTIVYQKFAF